MNLDDLKKMPKNKKEELTKHLKMGAEQGDIDCMIALGKSYLEGAFTPQDLKAAFKYYKMAADRGSIPAKFSLAKRYINGEGVEKNLKEATKIVKSIEESNDAEYICEVGFLYEKGLLGEVDNQKAFACFMKAATLGDHNAQCKVGNYYAEGRLGKEDWNKAVEWWTKSAAQGNAIAIQVLKDIKKEIERQSNATEETEEFKDIKKMAEDGNAEMQIRLGNAYIHGFSTKVDYNKSFEWYKKGADNGEVVGYYYCSQFYKDGIFEDDENHTLEIEYLLKASKGGCDKADLRLIELGVKLKNEEESKTAKKVKIIEKTSKNTEKVGKNTKKTQNNEDLKNGSIKYKFEIDYKKYNENKKKYIKTFEENLIKSELGDAEAMIKVADAYFAGYFELYDKEESIKWYNKAIEAGNFEGYVGLGRFKYFYYDYTNDIDKAKEYFQLAADKGSLLAKKWLARIDVYYNNNKEDGLARMKEIANMGNLSTCEDLAYYYVFNDENFEEAEKYINMSLELNSISVHEILARMYYNQGKYNECIKEFAIAIENGDSVSQQDVGFMYYHGDLLEVDYDKAFNWYNRAALCGKRDAYLYLGKCYNFAHGCKQDYKKALQYYEMAGGRGNLEAQHNAGFLYFDGIGTDVDYDRAFFLYDNAVKGGYFYAACNLGYCYEGGFGVEKDLEKAVYYYKLAAESGDSVQAMVNLGNCYYYGIGCEVNYETAFHWFNKAAERGHVEGLYFVGFMLRYNIGCEKNEKEAVKMFEKAAEQNDARSIAELGRCYYYGCGVEIDMQKSFNYYQKAADMGNGYALACIAAFNYVGRECKQDYRRAIEYFIKAMKRGNFLGFEYFIDSISQYNGNKKFYKDLLSDLEEIKNEQAWYVIAELCCKGELVDQDYEKAYRYLNMSCEKGYQDAINLRDMVFTKQGTVKKYIKTSNQTKEAFVDLSYEDMVRVKDLINKGYSLAKFPTSNALLTYKKRGFVDKYIQSVKCSNERVQTVKIGEGIERFNEYAKGEEEHIKDEVGKLIAITGAGLSVREEYFNNLKKAFADNSEK